MHSSQITVDRPSFWLIAVAALALAVLGACTSPVDPTAAGEGSPTEGIAGTPDAELTVSPTALVTLTPTPVPTVNAAESIGFYSAAHSLLNIGNYADAERRFDQVIALEPQFARGWAGRGQALMLQGKYDEAFFDFDRAIALKPNLAQAYAHRAMARMAINDVAGARRDALQALEIDSKSVESHLVMGRIYAQEGRYQESYGSFNRSIELAPEDPTPRLWRGRFYREIVGDYARALADIAKAIELQPAQAYLYVDRAILYRQLAQIASARADLEEALSLSTDPALARIYDQARDMLDELNEIYPAPTPTPVPPVA